MITVPGVDRFDATSLVADPRNVLLVTKGGGFLYIWHEPGIYEVHTTFLKSHRGRHALAACLVSARWMFTHTDCMTLLTRVPEFNVAAARATAFCGATKEFERKKVWPTKTGLVDMSFWALRYHDWARQTPDLMKTGHEFHKRLEAEFARHRALSVRHDDDAAHDLNVGACCEMIFGGQALKGIVLYNQWARFAGYSLINLISFNPLMIDIGDAILMLDLENRTFKMVKPKASPLVVEAP